MTKPIWKPLEKVLSEKKCVSFMYMGNHDYKIADKKGKTAGTKKIYDYKHHLTRRYLHITKDGKLFCRIKHPSPDIILQACSRKKAMDWAYEDIEKFGG